MNLPAILGINRTQDGTILIFDGGNHVTSIHKKGLPRTRLDIVKDSLTCITVNKSRLNNPLPLSSRQA